MLSSCLPGCLVACSPASLPRSLACLLACSLARSFARLLARSLARSLTCLPACLLAYLSLFSSSRFSTLASPPSLPSLSLSPSLLRTLLERIQPLPERPATCSFWNTPPLCILLCHRSRIPEIDFQFISLRPLLFPLLSSHSRFSCYFSNQPGERCASLESITGRMMRVGVGGRR